MIAWFIQILIAATMHWMSVSFIITESITPKNLQTRKITLMELKTFGTKRSES
jgi:hypothetical protein